MDPLDNQSIGADDLTPVAKSALLKARPWMLFFAILGFIYVALSVLGVIANFATGQIGSGMFSILTTALLGYFYWLLYQTTKGIKQFEMSGSPLNLENTLYHYKLYWLISGILTILGLIFMAFAIFGSVALMNSMSGM